MSTTESRVSLDATHAETQATHSMAVPGRERNPLAKRRGWLVRRGLLAADVVGALLAFVLAELVFPEPSGSTITPWLEAIIFTAILPTWLVMAKLYGLYDRDEERTDHSTGDDLIGVFHLVTVGTWVLYATSKLSGLADPNLERVLFFWGMAILLVTLCRAIARSLCRRHDSYLQNTIIVGAGEVGQQIAKKVLQHPEYGLNIVGFVDDEPREQRPELEGLTILGSPEDLPQLVRLTAADRVIFAFSRDGHKEILPLVRALSDDDIQVDIVPRYFDVIGPGVDLHTVEGLTLVGLRPFRLSRSSRWLKRAVDLVHAGIALFLLAPVFALIAVMIKLDSQGPIFFRQVRVGERGQPFRIWKFRTMSVDAEARKGEIAHLNMHSEDGDRPRMFKAPDDPRITRVGKLLRRWSIDEFPQFINVLVGEMSLVGPRPLILAEDQHVEDWARKRLNLKPGITGLWQAMGRSEIPFEEMVRLDYLYVTGWSPMTDLKLALRTIPALFRERRAY